MDKIVIYARDDLQAMVKAATFGKDTAAWLSEVRSAAAGMVHARPASYLTFGPYWWEVKAQLVAAGLMTGDVNESLRARISTGDEVRDFAGALAYHGWNVDQMRDGNVFALDTEAGDQVDYLLADEELDALISASPN